MRFFRDDADTTPPQRQEARTGRAVLAAFIGFVAVFLIFGAAMLVMVFLR